MTIRHCRVAMVVLQIVEEIPDALKQGLSAAFADTAQGLRIADERIDRRQQVFGGIEDKPGTIALYAFES
jgi:hypothetical protein